MLKCHKTTADNSRRLQELGTERVQVLADISRSAALYAFAVHTAISLHTCMLSQQRNPGTDCKSAKQCTTVQGTPTLPASYIRVRAVVWKCGDGQTDR